MSSVTSTTPPVGAFVSSSRPSVLTWIADHRLPIAMFVVLIAAAATTRLLTFDRYLPYLDYSDETVPFLVAQNMRGIFDDRFVEWRYAGYPPGYPVINIAVQLLVERF